MSAQTNGCFRNLLLATTPELLLAKVVPSDLDDGRIVEAKFGCKLMLIKSLTRSHQQLMAEAPSVLKQCSPNKQ